MIVFISSSTSQITKTTHNFIHTVGCYPMIVRPNIHNGGSPLSTLLRKRTAVIAPSVKVLVWLVGLHDVILLVRDLGRIAVDCPVVAVVA